METIIETNVKLTVEELKILSSKILEDFRDGVSISDIINVVTDSMCMVGQFSKMSGHDKKKLVIDMVVFVLNNTNSGPFETFEPYVIDIVPDMIDYLINVEKGKLKFNNKIKNSINCFNCL